MGEDHEPAMDGVEALDNSEAETAYLLRSPANRERLLKAIENVSQGRNLEIVDPFPGLCPEGA
jgi:PHD/YefM family antitoxin component YafN of YafNO toxin-antitoxin module